MKTPWHYLAWTPPQLEPKAERNLAAMTRSKGWIWAVLLFWGLPDGISGVALGKVRLFIAYNYTGILAGVAAWVSVQLGSDPGLVAVSAVVGLGWLATVAWGTAKYVGWLASILGRWPPMGRA